jgi:DNA ligase-1
MTTITYTPSFMPSDASAYLASEKLDGIRARWNRGRLWLRSGATLAPPAEWLAHLPPHALDGELYIGRGQFNELSGIVRKKSCCLGWANVRFMAFDMPDVAGPFHRRAAMLMALGARAAGNPVFQVIPQVRLRDITHAKTIFQKVNREAGEGLMLHRADAMQPDRPAALVKMKPEHDAEALVIEQNTGTGKHAGRLGALTVLLPSGKTFKLGTGFSDSERLYPPRLGSTVTYSYNELTPAGIPRFAKFVRERHIETMSVPA